MGSDSGWFWGSDHSNNLKILYLTLDNGAFQALEVPFYYENRCFKDLQDPQIDD